MLYWHEEATFSSLTKGNTLIMAVTTSTTTRDRVAGWLSPEEFTLIEAVCDTLLPTLEPPVGSSDAMAAYYRRNAADLHVPMLFAETLAHENAETQTEFRQLLATMASPVGGLLLIANPKPFIMLMQEQREKYLLAMANSPVAQLRQGYQALKRLATFIFYAAPNPHGINPNWGVLDYDAPTPPPPTPRTIKPLAITQNVTLECDAVVIGSGAGGGVVAGELALAGKSVVVLEKGGYNSEADFTYQEAQAMPELYLKRGSLATKDLSMTILAGSTLGGGTVVNWNTSFRTPDDVLAEWAATSGLPDFTGSALQASFAVFFLNETATTENSEHNTQNRLLFDGSAALGYHAGVIRRNAVGCEQRCGACCFGCRYECKQSTTKTYLQDAYDKGARIIVRCSVEKVLIENGKAVGVVGKALDTVSGETFDVTVRASVVVLAAGTINSPAVLLRSGLENKHIGRHLKLHPVSTVSGVYPEKVYPWRGVMQSAYTDEFAHLHDNYGYKLEVAPAHPGLIGLTTPWYGARAYRESMLDAPNLATIIVLTRDKGEGTVTTDRDGEPVVNYTTSPYDRQHLLHGLRTSARVHFAAGAKSVLSLHTKQNRVDRFADGTVSPRDLSDFDARIERYGMGPNRMMMFSAHQMGTCRMGSDAKNAVTDGNGEVYGVKGLFVCDGSVFPAASGVNPMLSIMGLSHRSAQYIKSVL